MNDKPNEWAAVLQPGPPRTIWLRMPWLPESLNRWSRAHWSRRHRTVRELSDALRVLARSERLPTFKRATVRVTYFFPDRRRRDPDNYMPKALLDALRHAGILTEDNAQAISLPQPTFAYDPGWPRTVVLVEEAREACAG